MKNVFGKNLKIALINRGVSQKQLANRIGITEAAVSRYVSGNREPRGHTCVAIAHALNVTVEDLYADHKIGG